MSGERDIKPSSIDGSDKLNLRVADAMGQEVHFVVTPNTRMEKIFAAFCAKRGRERTGLRFMYNGVRIAEDETPKSLDMESDDIIDVLEEQTGGAPTTSQCVLFLW